MTESEKAIAGLQQIFNVEILQLQHMLQKMRML